MNVAFVVFLAAAGAVWFAMVGRVTPLDVGQGLIVCLSAWWLFDRVSEFGNRVPAARAAAFARGVGGYLFGYVSVAMVRSTLQVFRKALSPRLALRPAILAVSIPEASPAALMLLAYGISLTPGQQVVAIDEARRILYVHTIDVPDPQAVRDAITRLYHRYVKEGTQW